MEDPESVWTKEDGQKERLAEDTVGFLKEMTGILKEYFSLEMGEVAAAITSDSKQSYMLVTLLQALACIRSSPEEVKCLLSEKTVSSNT